MTHREPAMLPAPQMEIDHIGLSFGGVRALLSVTFNIYPGSIQAIIGPNGAGKSTILEAIAWALYGTPAARGNRDGIRSLSASPRAQVRVELDFEPAEEL